MLASFAVTRFAGDPELRHLRIPFVALDETRFAVRDVAIHARAVPCTDGIVFLQVGRNEKCFANRRPHFFGHDVGKRKLFQRAAFARLEPRDLQVVRAGNEHDLPRVVKFFLPCAGFGQNRNHPGAPLCIRAR